MTKGYLELRREALVLADRADYDLSASEMNPVILETLVAAIMDRGLYPLIWEPFGGNGGSDRAYHFATDNGVTFLSYGLRGSLCSFELDSTKNHPRCSVGAVLFHPTYFGYCPKDAHPREIGQLKDKVEYMSALAGSIANIRECLVEGGLVCAVGRDYRVGGNRVQLDQWYLEVFSDGFELIEVWASEPDVALLLRRTG